MPYNIIVLSEQPIMYNPIFLNILYISLTFIFITTFVIIICMFFSYFSIFSVFDFVFDIATFFWTISTIVCLISLFVSECYPYEDTGRKKYSVVAQTEEQIEYIYDNYDITGSDGDIYYIEEREN